VMMGGGLMADCGTKMPFRRSTRGVRRHG
jgi:hypothetical protein